MFRTLGATALLTLACAMPVQKASAQDPIAGGIFGGAVGGLLGGAIGGRGGAVAGAIIGGTTGAAIAAEGQRRNGYYWYRNGCYVQQPDGSYAVVPPAYCGPGGPVVGPAAVAAPPGAVADDDDEVEYIQGAGPQRAANPDAVAACARKYRSYDPRSMTFLSNDGTRKSCP
jgi:hypothetical protein